MLSIMLWINLNNCKQIWTMVRKIWTICWEISGNLLKSQNWCIEGSSKVGLWKGLNKKYVVSFLCFFPLPVSLSFFGGCFKVIQGLAFWVLAAFTIELHCLKPGNMRQVVGLAWPVIVTTNYQSLNRIKRCHRYSKPAIKIFHTLLNICSTILFILMCIKTKGLSCC